MCDRFGFRSLKYSANISLTTLADRHLVCTNLLTILLRSIFYLLHRLRYPNNGTYLEKIKVYISENQFKMHREHCTVGFERNSRQLPTCTAKLVQRMAIRLRQLKCQNHQPSHQIIATKMKLILESIDCLPIVEKGGGSKLRRKSRWLLKNPSPLRSNHHRKCIMLIHLVPYPDRDYLSATIVHGWHQISRFQFEKRINDTLEEFKSVIEQKHADIPKLYRNASKNIWSSCKLKACGLKKVNLPKWKLKLDEDEIDKLREISEQHNLDWNSRDEYLPLQITTGHELVVSGMTELINQPIVSVKDLVIGHTKYDLKPDVSKINIVTTSKIENPSKITVTKRRSKKDAQHEPITEEILKKRKIAFSRPHPTMKTTNLVQRTLDSMGVNTKKDPFISSKQTIESSHSRLAISSGHD